MHVCSRAGEAFFAYTNTETHRSTKPTPHTSPRLAGFSFLFLIFAPPPPSFFRAPALVYLLSLASVDCGSFISAVWDSALCAVRWLCIGPTITRHDTRRHTHTHAAHRIHRMSVLSAATSTLIHPPPRHLKLSSSLR